MYPLRAVLIGTGELRELPSLLTTLTVPIAGQYPDIGAFRQVAPQGTPNDTLFILSMRGEADIAALRLLNDAYPGRPVLALINGRCAAETLYRINRCGAAQIVPEPWQLADLEDALLRVARQFGRASPPAVLLAVAGIAEGCGATTLAANLSWEIHARWKKRCVLVEPFVPVGRVASRLGVESPLLTRELYADAGPVDSATVQRALTPVTDGLFLLAGPPFGQAAPRPSVERVMSVLESLRRTADVIVLDLSMAVEEDHQLLICQADLSLLVTEQLIPSLQGLRQLADALARQLPMGRVVPVINRFDPNLTYFTPERIKKLFSLSELWTVADDPVGCRAAVNEGNALSEASPKSPALRDINRLLQSVFGPPKVAAGSPRGG